MSAETSSHEAALEAAECIRRYNVWQGVYESAAADTLHLDGLVSGNEEGSAVINMPGQKFPSVVLHPVRGETSGDDRLFVTERSVGHNGTVKALFARTVILYQDGSAPNTIVAWHHVTGKAQRVLGMIDQKAHETNIDELHRLDSVFDEIDEARRISFAKRAGNTIVPEPKASFGRQVGRLIKKHTR